MASISLAVASLAISGPALGATSIGAWPIYNDWNYPEFQKYSKWVHHIYLTKRNGSSKQRFAMLDRIILDDEMNLLNVPSFLGQGNPQVKTPQRIRQLTHCGNFPALLLLYYSYRRGLPIVFSKIGMGPIGKRDIRYAVGNYPVREVDSINTGNDFYSYMVNALTMRGGNFNFVSGNFRTAPYLERTDSVPISLDRKFLMPGTVCYNSNGHVLVVGEVSDSGEVHFIDAHPDNSITANQALSAIQYVSPAKEGKNGLIMCYDGFRNPRLAKVVGKKAVHFTNEEMKALGLSTEQYDIMAELRKRKELEVKGQKVTNFPQVAKAKLRTKKETPLPFLETTVRELADMFVERENFVQDAWKDVLKYGHIVFPNESKTENIYQALGRWEVWSSPSSDVDRKNKYLYTMSTLEDMLKSFGKTEVYDYSGYSSASQLAKAIQKRKDEMFGQISLTYTNSVGGQVTLKLEDIEKRLFAISFDPNHCPELRWGAPAGSDERKTMKLLRIPLRTGQTLDALKAYELEQGLRYSLSRQYGPSSLHPDKNPKMPPFVLMDAMLAKYK